MKVCLRCGACYDDDYDLCAYDGEQIATAFPGSRVLSERYRLEFRLAGGGMGVVYRATHLQLGSTVAVKLMHLDRSGSRRIAAARFHREAQILGQIKHPNAVLVTDFGVERRASIDVPYLVTEFLNGEPLSARIAVRGRLSLAETERIISPLCEAVEEAHRIGVVHRDIKPPNVFLERVGDGSEIVKVLDFGIAKFVADAAVPAAVQQAVIVVDPAFELDGLEDTRPDRGGDGGLGDRTEPEMRAAPLEDMAEDTVPEMAAAPALAADPIVLGDPLELTLPGAIMGTVRYMAPEQIAGEPVTPRTDVYAVATLAVRLLSGDVPISGTDEEIVHRKLKDEPIALSGLPPKLAGALSAALSRDPARRPESARAIAVALREAAISRNAPAIREPLLALAVQIGAITALIKRLTGEIHTWAGVRLDELQYQRARDQLLALDLPLSKAIDSIERCPAGPAGDNPVVKELEDFDEAIEAMTAALRAAAGETPSEYVEFLSVVGSRQTASAAGISRRIREKLKLAGASHADFSLDLARTPRQSRLLLEDLTSRLLSPGALESADAIDSVLHDHLELIREVLARNDARDVLVTDLVLGLWRHVDAILLRELFPVSRAPDLLPVLAGLGITASEPFATIAEVFAAPRRLATAEWVRARFQKYEAEIARALWRCALVHPLEEIRRAALAIVPRSELWTAIAYPRTPLAYQRAILERLRESGASAEHLEIFFLCISDNLAAAQGEGPLGEAFRIVSLLLASEAMRDPFVVEPLLKIEGELRARCSRAGIEVELDDSYAARLAALADRGAPAPAPAPSGMADIPLAIQRDIARRGAFINFYVSHTVDAIARETLPHLFKLDDVTSFLLIPTINRSVLVTLSRKRHYFRKESARLALLHNPKTPAPTARVFLPFLNHEQLRRMIADRMIGADTRQLAQQFLARAEREGSA